MAVKGIGGELILKTKQMKGANILLNLTVGQGLQFHNLLSWENGKANV